MADLRVIIKALFEGGENIDNAKEKIGELGGAAEEMEKAGSDSFGEFQDNVAIAMLGINQAIEVGIKLAEAAQVVYENTVGKALSVAGEIEELSRVSGEAPENMSALRVAAEESKVPFDDLYKAMDNLNKNGVPPTIDNLVAIADEYVNLQDPIAQAQLLTENFGSAGDDIAPMLEAIADGVKAVDDAGLIFTEEEIQAAKDYEAAMAGLKGTWDGFTIAIGQEIIPALTGLIDSFGSLELDGGGIGGFFKREIESISTIALQFQLAGLAADAFKDKEINLVEYGDALWTAFGSAATTTADLREEITNLGGHFDDLTMKLFDQSTSFADFKIKMDEAGLSIGILDEATYNAEKGFEDLNTAIEKVPGIKTIEVELTVDDSAIKNYTPPTKTGTVVYQPNTHMSYAVGGAVTGGNPYNWQEYGYRGEVFVPSADGFVLSRADAERALARALYGGGSAVDPESIGKAVAQALSGITGSKKGGNVYNLTMPTSSNPADVRTAFELMEAWA